MQRYKLLAVTTFVGALALAATALAQTTLPQPDPPFKGKISLTPAELREGLSQGDDGAGRRPEYR